MDASRLRINIEQILAPVWLSRFFHARSRLLSATSAPCAATAAIALSRIRHRRYTHFSGPCRLIERTQTSHQVASGAGFRRCPESQMYEEQR